MSSIERSAVRLADPALAPLIDELARRFEQGDTPVRITLPVLDDQGRSLLADLLGTDRYLDHRRPLSVERLVSALGVGDPEGLRAVVEAVRGPLVDRREQRRLASAARDSLWEDTYSAATDLSLFDTDRSMAWVERLRVAGVPEGDVERHRARVETVIAVLARLPTAEPLTLAGLAADVCGDAHALDPGRRVTRMAIDALAIGSGVETPGDAEAVRHLWETYGVVVDPLSSTVLTLGLRAPAGDPLTAFLNASADRAEPVMLTYAQLSRWPVTAPTSGPSAFLFENPALLAEAAGTGWRGPPLLCSSGRPSVAVVTLARQLASSGSVVHQHADFDPAGLAITAWLQSRARTVPWRMTAEAYREAVFSTGPRLAISGPVPGTPWDPDLHSEMTTTGRVVHEEAIRADLLRRTESDSP